MKKWTLKGKNAFISGGTKGIGLEVVNDFLKLGATVFTVARNEDNLNALLDEFKDQNLAGMVCDVSDKNSRSELVKLLLKNYDKMDIVVNNAGSNIRKKSFEYTEDEIRYLFDLNYFGTVDICRSLFPLLKLSGKASVINISSTASILDLGTGFPYASAKSAVNQLTRSLASEWGKYNIRVNAILPWFVKTPLTESYLADNERYGRIVDRTPLGRVGTPDEVSSVAAFLAMDISSYITGQCLAVDGGVSISVFGK
jgi:Tropinone reductase 1